MAKKSVTLKNRDIMEAAQALAAITSQRWSDSQVALYLGKSFRALREANEDTEKVRATLLDQFAARDEDGAYRKDQLDGTIRLVEPTRFQAEWRKLLETEVEVTLYPVKLDALIAANGQGKKRCKQCDRPLTPDISMQQLESLVHVGAILSAAPADEDEQKGAAEKDEDE